MQKNPYSPAYYQQIRTGSLASAQEVLPIVQGFVQPASVVDIGCGIGTWLSVWRSLGMQKLHGIDGSYIQPSQLLIPKEDFTAANLDGHVDAPEKYDLVMSLEVAEHIRPENAATFVKTLCSFGDVVLFSAAVPGQGGVEHLNEQYPQYWAELFARNGFTGYDCIRSKIWLNKKIDTCYRQNLLFFVKDSVKEQYPAITSVTGPLLPLVHPEHFEKKNAILLSYQNVVRTPFHAGWHFLKQWFPFLRKRDEKEAG